jgi:glutaredoxin
MKKNKKKHKGLSHDKRPEKVSEIETEIVPKAVLSEDISALQTNINVAGLTPEDMAEFKARIDAANAKLASVQQTNNNAAHALAYARLKDATEKKILAYETLANANPLTQKIIDAAHVAKVEIDIVDLTAQDVEMFEERINVANEKIALGQNTINEVDAYMALKSEMEAKIAAIEALANNSVSNADSMRSTQIDSKKYIDENKEEKKTVEQKSQGSFMQGLIQNKSRIFVSIFALLVLASFGFSYAKKVAADNGVALKDKTEKYIKDNLVKAGTDLKIDGFQKDGNLYKMTVSVGGQNIVAYVTADGSKFFPQVVELDKKAGDQAAAAGATPTANTAPAPVAEVTQKNDVPTVELFVMSQCPYGVQAEKGILPAIAKLGSKINFSVKFVDYTLHGKKEFDENLNQYCIQKEEPAKFNDYLTSYVKGGDAAASVVSAKIDSAKIAACITSTDKQFKLTESFVASGQSPFNIQKDLNDKYGVQGSPSLVVNGQLIDSARDSATLLKTICSGFSNQPEECKSVLPATNPTPGFGA